MAWSIEGGIRFAIMVYNFLRKIPLFAGLSHDDLERLCEMVSEVRLSAGEELFAEGDPGDKAYVIKEGQLEILKNSGGQGVILAVRQPGEVIGEMALLESAPRFATVRARADSLLLEIDHKHLDELLNTSPSAAKGMLYTITSRLRSTELVLRQSERMAQLGSMTAGIAHELNNPAAAMGRGASQLQDAIHRLQHVHLRLTQWDLSQAQIDALLSLDQVARERARKPVEIDLVSRSDREDEVADWLEEYNVREGWELAPAFVELGYGPAQLDEFAEVFSSDQFLEVARWLEATYSTYELLEEIVQGTSRMSEIVKALKSYVYLDQAAIQEVDLHEGLDNTLVMMRSKLKGGVVVHREYDSELPRIMAYASELNQVWTNLMDNAIDAMNGKGVIKLRTRHEENWVFVEFEDSGPGIPSEIQDRIFSPFFTTKAIGKGSGLGLNISYNIVKKHGGDIQVVSRPGMTCFMVSLPVNFENMQSKPVGGFYSVPSDLELLRILEESRSIAVVGISNAPDMPARMVPAYLQQAGYRIIPVNPELDEVLGEKAFPDLLAIAEPVDVVLIFRRSEYVPEIVDQAIEIGAGVIWMQEGIINEAAAAAAEKAGMKVVMDTCMRTTHRRLVSP